VRQCTGSDEAVMNQAQVSCSGRARRRRARLEQRKEEDDHGEIEAEARQAAVAHGGVRRGGGVPDGVPAAEEVRRGGIRMAMVWFRVGYPRVSSFAGSSSGMISHPQFLGSGPRNFSGSVSGLVFSSGISNG